MEQTTPHSLIRLVTHDGDRNEIHRNFDGVRAYEVVRLPDEKFKVSFTVDGSPCSFLCSEDDDQIIYVMNPDTGRTRFRYPPFNRD